MIIYKQSIHKISLVREKADFKKVKITSSLDGYKYALQFYSDDIDLYESMFAIFLNRANNTTAFAKISQGGISETTADPMLITKYAVEFMAKGLILVHNHPSGITLPSESDKIITKKIQSALANLDVAFLDHLIITDDKYLSFADEGLM